MIAVLLLATVVLAGCTGGKSNSANDNKPTGPAGPAQVDAETGGIEGIVVDETSEVLAEATVGIASEGLETRSDSEGKFSLSNVKPGTYQLQATLIGYSTDVESVEVIAGQVTSGITFQLNQVEIPNEVYHLTIPVTGFVNCGAGVVVVRATSACTADPNHKTRFLFEVNGNVKTITGELVWQPAAGFAARQLELDLWQNTTCNPCEPEQSYGEVIGVSPVVVRADAPYAGVAAEGNTTLEWFVWTPFSEDNPPLPIVVFNQGFTIYQTIHYGEKAPEGFTGVPG